MLNIIIYNQFNLVFDLFTDFNGTISSMTTNAMINVTGFAVLFCRYHAGTLGWMHGYLKDDNVKVFRATRVMLEGRYSIVGRFVVRLNICRKIRWS